MSYETLHVARQLNIVLSIHRRFYALTPKISKENSQWDIRKQISHREPTHFLISIGSLSVPGSLCKDHSHLPPSVFVHTDCEYDSASVGASSRASFQAPEPWPEGWGVIEQTEIDSHSQETCVTNLRVLIMATDEDRMLAGR